MHLKRSDVSTFHYFLVSCIANRIFTSYFYRAEVINFFSPFIMHFIYYGVVTNFRIYLSVKKILLLRAHILRTFFRKFNWLLR